MDNTIPLEELFTCLVIFKEHPIVNYITAEPGIFDISATGTSIPPDFITDESAFSMLHYCMQLIRRLITLAPPEISHFLDYQCNKMKDALSWLNSLEKLLQVNAGIFITNKEIGKLSGILIVIEQKKSAVIQLKYAYSFHPAEPYIIFPNPFDSLKLELDKIDIFEDKITFLLNRKAEYLQNEPPFIHKHQKPLDVLIDLEIKKLYQIEWLKKQKQNNSNELQPEKPKYDPKKLHFNGHLNILVDAFYQMKNKESITGVPYINASIQEITDWIVANFLGKDGKEISAATVRTILSPGRHEKRPKQDNRIMVKKEK